MSVHFQIKYRWPEIVNSQSVDSQRTLQIPLSGSFAVKVQFDVGPRLEVQCSDSQCMVPEIQNQYPEIVGHQST